MSVSLLETLNLTLGTGDRAFNANPGSAPKGCVVFIIHNANSDFIAGVDYGGVALTEVTGSPLGKAGGEPGIVHAFFAGSGLPSGAQSVTVDTTSGSTYCAVCYVLGGAADLELVDIETLNSNSLANPSMTLSLGGRECFAAVGGFSGQDTFGGVTPLSGWANSAEQDFGSQMGISYAYNTIGTSDVTAGWTQTAEDVLAIAVAVGEISGAYTLTCVTGSFVLTGNAVGLGATRQLPATTQAYALAGVTTGLRADRRLVATQQGYALTGVATGLRAARLLTAAAGSYALTGPGTNLLAQRRLTAQLGTFALTGNASGLVRAARLTATTGTLTLSGITATLTYGTAGGSVLSAAPGTFALTGNATGLRAARQLPATTRAYTLTGIASGLRVNRLLAATARSYALTGIPASLRAARRLPATTTGFQLAGLAATLTWAPDPGAIQYFQGVHFAAVAIARAGFAGAAIAPPRLAGLTLARPAFTAVAVTPEG